MYPPPPPHTHTHRTAPQRRQTPDSIMPTFPGNPNFTRGAASRSTYAFEKKRPPAPPIRHYEAMGGANSQASPGGPTVGGGFFKRMISSRFSKRYKRRYNRVTVSSGYYGVHCATN